ncbi:hypothetical protein HRR80_007033 [Exophiala dermatitidis]|uniref:Uncharacterized protein n=1 Tax=Exophiala dermatitidis TaxID=5970 RepID=A0AAN6ES29_EXODE|nr:hypothetical protein HRR74_005558 [Exophiala dermatitidis]KAJ4517585.1 hypothetical protein HRR73_004637 [Exophiala dermatitidis]KAJ4610497.1 hypothetical protein HRR85_005751 [Exophiala dermatitidis]KAJ4668818.1 hypothetical protein HRR93_006463 [Exophiala dermatitidis]KAJ8988827.1 hypothetical protein HRR80_007033 [Exophiala dermatitidis]
MRLDGNADIASLKSDASARGLVDFLLPYFDFPLLAEKIQILWKQIIWQNQDQSEVFKLRMLEPSQLSKYLATHPTPAGQLTAYLNPSPVNWSGPPFFLD